MITQAPKDKIQAAKIHHLNIPAMAPIHLEAQLKAAKKKPTNIKEGVRNICSMLKCKLYVKNKQ